LKRSIGNEAKQPCKMMPYFGGKTILSSFTWNSSTPYFLDLVSRLDPRLFVLFKKCFNCK